VERRARDINPHIRRDAYYPQLATALATAARTGADVRGLMAYPINLFTADHPFLQDIPVPDELPPTPEDEEELRVLGPRPRR
jgi:hypothetical protein